MFCAVNLALHRDNLLYLFFKILSEIGFSQKIVCIFTAVKHQFKSKSVIRISRCCMAERNPLVFPILKGRIVVFSTTWPNTPSSLRLIGVCHFKASLLSKIPDRANPKKTTTRSRSGRCRCLFLIDIIRSFSNLALPPHQMAKGTKEFL